MYAIRSYYDNENCERQSHAAAPMIIIGDAFHNAIDGVVIAASFLSSKDRITSYNVCYTKLLRALYSKLQACRSKNNRLHGINQGHQLQNTGDRQTGDLFKSIKIT